MAITAIPFKNNAIVSFNGVVIGGLRSVATNSTMGTWDATAHDNTSGVRTHFGTYSDSTVAMTGVFDPEEAGQLTLPVVVVTGATHELIVTFADGVTMTVQAICTEFSTDGDYESGWTWSGSFQNTGVAVWDLTRTP